MKKSEAASTKAWPEGGLPCSSVEAAVIAAEQRGRVVLAVSGINSFGRMST